jgi:hypothetical protein
MSEHNSDHVRRFIRGAIRLGILIGCVSLCAVVVWFGSRFLSNRRVMILARPADPRRTQRDVIVGWKYVNTGWLERWVGNEVALQLLSHPTSVLVQGTVENVPDSTVVELLKASSGVKEVFIHNRNLPEGCLEIIADRHPVEVLQFRLPTIGPNDAKQLSRMVRLRHVNVGQFVREPRQNDWTWLSQLPKLNQFECTLWGASDDDVRSFAGCPASRNLSLSGELSDQALAGLCDLPKLEFLHLEGPQIKLQFAGKTLPQSLQSLDLHSEEATDESLSAIVGLPGVNRISLTGGVISNHGMKVLSECPSLRQLWLDELTAVTDEGMKALSSSPSLTEVLVTRCGVTSAGLVHLNAVPNWVDLYFDGVRFQRQANSPKPIITADNAEEVLRHQRELMRMQNEVGNHPMTFEQTN